jgi:hypothetical protein
VHKGCWIALVLALGCGDDDGGDRGQQSSAAATCAKSCARAATARCPNQPSDCAQRCEAQIAATPAVCIANVNSYASCLSTAVFSCDRAGLAEATGCAAELTGWLTCASGGVQDAQVSLPGDAGPLDGGAPDARSPDASAPDASAPDANAPDSSVPDAGGGLSCVVEPLEQECDECLKQECCESLSACTGQCMQLLSCSQSCFDDACADSCALQYPGGVEGVNGIYDCMVLDCADSCEAELGG